MTNKELYSGVWTALITPFTEIGEVDYEAFDNLIEMQIAGGVRGILLLGTTGESPTLLSEEKVSIIKRGIEKINKRCLVMVNSGTNSTNVSIETTKEFDKIPGIDAFLIVNPYYNKPTQEGLYRHFKAIGDSIKKPFFIYNIFGRTCVNLETETLLKLSNNCKNVVGVKEASGNLEQMQEVINTVSEDFVVLSGDDSLTLDLIKMGGSGVVSVASNYIPKTIVNLIKNALQKDYSKAEKINNDLGEFFDGEFIQTNPLPIKVALAEQGVIKEVYRLPLCEMDTEPRKEWINILKKYKGQN